MHNELFDLSLLEGILIMTTKMMLLNYLAALLLFLMWGTLVLLGKSDPQPFIIAISGALSGLGVHAVVKSSMARKLDAGNSRASDPVPNLPSKPV